MLTFLLIEILDELVFGAGEAAWPLIRTDLGLDYAQIGLLLSLPHLFSSLVEPFVGVLGDTGRRRTLVLGGGVALGLAMLLIGLSRGFPVLLAALLLAYPASGAFVTLSQATLMDGAPDRREKNMVRWTLAGSVGLLAGPLALSGAVAVGLGWRGLYGLFAALAWGMVILAARFRLTGGPPEGQAADLVTGLGEALRAVRRGEVLRWLVLLELADLMLDVFLGFQALYFVDVVGVPPAQAGVAVAVGTGAGLLGNSLLLFLLERVPGQRVLRWSGIAVLILFPAFLLGPGFWPRVVLLGLLGLSTAGWYPVLQARLYAVLPGQSGTVMAVGNLSRLVGGAVPLVLGLLAERFGLGATMWLLLAGPLALLLGLPWRYRPALKGTGR